MKKRFPTFWHLVVILLLIMVFQIPFSMPMVAFKEYKAFFFLLSYVFSMAATIWVVRRLYHKKSKFNFQPVHLAILPLVVLVTYLFFVFGNISLSFLPEPTGFFKKLFDMMQESMQSIFTNKFLAFIILAVAAPVLEETLFRGIILKALLKKYTPYKAIVISAVVFGVFHMNPWQFLYAFILGLWLGYIYWKTRTLFYPVLIHFIANSTAFLLMLKYGVDMENDPFTQNQETTLFVALSAGILVLLWLAYRYFEKYFSTTEKSIVLATQNPHKIAEIQKILPENFKLISLQDIGFNRKLRETGKTLKANALQKMRQVAVPYDVDAIADDTGLEVEALNGAPGVYSARYAGEEATYEDNVQKLLAEMQGQENRNARFRTVVAMNLGNKEYVVEGAINGKITTEPRGENGFGYDSVFMPDGYDKTFAEMTEDEKNQISHRALALKNLKKIFDAEEAVPKK